MKKHIESIPAMILLLLVPLSLIVALCFSCEPAHAQTVTPSPSPVPTPADDATAEEVYEYILEQPGYEWWVDSNYDPVETRVGECVRIKDVVYQIDPFAVICTFGYENKYYNDGSGDIRGLNSLGFIDIEGTGVAFRLMDLFVSNAYAANDKWKKVKAIKIVKNPKKPTKPKKVKWKKEYGLKEKKHDLEVTP